MATPPSKYKTPAQLRSSATRRLAAGTAPSSNQVISASALSFLHQLASSSANGHNVMALLNEIQVNQVELDMQQAQIEFDAQDSAEDLRCYQERYDCAPFSYFVVNQSGYIIEGNRVGAELFGFEPGDMEGCDMGSFLAAESRQTFAALMLRLCRGSGRETCTVQLAGTNTTRRLKMLATASPADGLFFVTLIDPSDWQF